MIDYDGELVDELTEIVGENLRSVASYDRGGHTMHYIRDDVRAQYSDDEIAKAYKQIEIEGMGYGRFEEFFHTGHLEAAIYGFERALMFHFPTGAFTGLFVSVDRMNDMDIDTIIERCKTAIQRQ